MQYLVLLSVLLLFCQCAKDLPSIAANSHIQAEQEWLGQLYYEADSVTKHGDTIKIYNSKLDTVVIETGIFTQLRYDYPMAIPPVTIDLTKEAIKLEQNQEFEKAKEHYLGVIEYYYEDLPKIEFSCGNDYFTHHVHNAILASHAYERLGEADGAINILKPWLANWDAYDTQIFERYITLSIDKYGFEKVRAEFDNASNTLTRKIVNPNPEDIQWTVSIFGAPFEVGDKDNITREEAMHNLTTGRYCYLLGY